MTNEEITKKIIDDTYIDWLERQFEGKEEINSANYPDDKRNKTSNQLKDFFKELLLYQIEYQNNACLASFLKRGKNIYAFRVEKDNSITCKKYTFPLNSDVNFPIIEYKKFKQHLIEKLLSLKPIIEQTMKEPLKFYDEICYTIPLKERLLILKHLENKSCETCTNGSCNIETCEKVGIDEYGYPMGHDCIGWFNPNIIGKSRVLAKLDINELKHS